MEENESLDPVGVTFLRPATVMPGPNRLAKPEPSVSEAWRSPDPMTIHWAVNDSLSGGDSGIGSHLRT